jgi:pimeloyl-ACP methyl ester carboxylesterase
MYYASLYPTAKPADFARYLQALTANLREPGRIEAVQAMLRASKGDVWSRLDGIEVPALVVMGEKDPDFAGVTGGPSGEANLVAEKLRGRALMVAGAGHYPHVEMAEQVGPQIVQFLSSVSTGPEAGGAEMLRAGA